MNNVVGIEKSIIIINLNDTSLIILIFNIIITLIKFK